MNLEELRRLLDPETKGLIEKHIEENPATFALKYHKTVDMPVRAVAEQIACRRKAAKKLPELSRRNLLYTSLSLEQASGERTAAYKSGLEGMAGKKMLDMTGGLGIDAVFFSSRFEEVVYVERDEVLAKIAAHNFREIGVDNITVVRGDSSSVLEAFPDDTFDWIYLDPARREKGTRSVALEEARPNVVALHNLLLQKAKKFCVKASPALEISVLSERLPLLSEVIVLSVERECREILLICERERNAPAGVVKAACLRAGTETVVSSGEGEVPRKIITGDIGKYFYEPDPAIIKARLTEVLAMQQDLRFINSRVDYLTSERKIVSFPGRVFRVRTSMLYRPKTFRRFLKDSGITEAGIQRRDFPLSPDEIRRMYRLKESDRLFIFFSKDFKGRLLCLFCERET